MRPTDAVGAPRSAHLRRALEEFIRRRERSPFREHRALFVRGLLACAAFAVLLGGAWLVGIHSIPTTSRDHIGAGQTETHRVGWIIREQPDGLSCSYAPFDTVTERVGEAIDAICESAARKQKAGGWSDFAWGRD